MIRLWQPGDESAIADIYGHYVRETAISFETSPPSVDEIARRIEGTRRFPWYVAEVDSDVAAYAYAGAYRERAAYQWSAEVSVYSRVGFQRRGVGRDLYTALIARMRELGYANLFAVITQPNEPSVRFHESLGFTPAGMFRNVGQKFGWWYDVGHWQLALDSCTEPLPPPRSHSDSHGATG